MFASRADQKLMSGRKIVLRMESDGIPLLDALAQIAQLLASLPDKSDLMFGYWEYGDEIVITAPDSP